MEKTLIVAFLENVDLNKFADFVKSSEQPLVILDRIIPNSNINKTIQLNDLQQKINKVEDYPYTKFIFLGADKNIFPDCLIRDVFSKRLIEVKFLDHKLQECNYNRFNNVTSSSISCFPGSIYPINMGSHQRAFGILKYLNDNNHYTDILITAGNEKTLKISKKLLSLISPRVFGYSNKRRKLPRKLRYRRLVENYIATKILKKNKPSDTFEERLNYKATTSAKKTIAKLINDFKYKNVIINYAWMEPVLEQSNYEHINLICDTHDVQYIRNETANKGSFRLFVSKSKEKNLELKSLKSFNHVLTISKPDHERLSESIKNSQLTVSGFDYAYIKPKLTKSKKQLDFGFIGGAMQANVQSVEYVINEWWPKISAFSPKSKLYIAGSICNNDTIKNLAFLNESIVLLGFVNSLTDFYSKFDILLNPVIVKGGLNFKSVESMAAGKILFTNTMGNDCLRIPDVIRVIDNNKNLIDNLIKLDRDRKYLHSEIRRSQALSLKHFSDSSAYKNLMGILK